jgi:transposase
MSERQFRLNEQQVGELRRAGTETIDSDTQTRFQAVRLYGTAYPLQTILDVTGCHPSTLRTWVHTYRTAGVAGLFDHRSGGNSAKLTPDQRREVEERLQQYTPRQILGAQTQTPTGQFWTVEDLQGALRRWYGVQYDSRVSYLNLLHACGFTYQRTEKVFKSQRPAEIAAFEELVEKNSWIRPKSPRRRSS